MTEEIKLYRTQFIILSCVWHEEFAVAGASRRYFELARQKNQVFDKLVAAYKASGLL